MIKFLITLIFLNFSVFSQETEECNFANILGTSLDSIASSFQIPNCTQTGFFELNQNAETICACKDQFDKSVGHYSGLEVMAPNPSVKNILLDELKKSLSSNILDIAKLRTVFSTGADFSSAAAACNIDQIKSLNCITSTDYEDFKNSLATELSKVLSPAPSFDDTGILKRESASRNCSEISDQEIVRVSSLSLEEFISGDNSVPNIVDRFSNLSPISNDGINGVLRGMGSEFAANIFKTHPVFSKLLSDPAELKNFFTSLRRPPSLENIRSNLYQNDRSNKMLASSIESSCKKAISAFKQNACSDHAKNNRVRIENLKLPNPYSQISSPRPGNFVRPEPVDTANIRLNGIADFLKICKIRTNDSTAPELNSLLSEISNGMYSEYKSLSLSKYGSDRYTNEFSGFRSYLCDAKAPGACPQGSSDFKCRMLNIYNKTKIEGTPENRLSSTSDPSINSLLRAMIGNPSARSLPIETSRVLIAEGIIPQENGEFITSEQFDRRPGSSFGRPADPTLSDARVAQAGFRQPLRNTTGATRTYDSTTSAAATLSSETGITGGNQDLDSSTLIDSIGDQMRSNLLRSEVDAIARGQQQGNSVGSQQRRTQNGRTTQPLPTANLQPTGALPLPNVPANPTGLLGGSSGDTARPLEDVTPFNEQVRRAQAVAARAGMAGAQGGTAAGGSVAGAAAGAGAGIGQPNRAPGSVNEAPISLEVAADASNVSDVLIAKLSSNDSSALQLQRLISGGQGFTLRLNERVVQINFEGGQFRVATGAGLSDRAKNQIESILNDPARRRQPTQNEAARLRELQLALPRS